MKAGTTFIITTGALDSFEIKSTLRAKVDLDFDAELEAWLQLHPKQAEDYSFEAGKFLEWLLERGVVETEPVLTLHLGDYSCVARAPEKKANEPG